MYRSILAFVLLGVFGAALAEDKAAASVPQTQVIPNGGEDATPPTCPQETGTRLRRKPGECLSIPGRTYGSEELRATGATNVGDGLQRMDPALITSH